MHPKRPLIFGVIPVRMESTRLPGKPLRSVCGRPMVSWVYERSRRSNLLDRLTVATDSDPILAYCGEQGIPVVRTSAQHISGTNRLIEVMDQESLMGNIPDIFVNIQGDEPMVTEHHVDLLLRPFRHAPSRLPPSTGDDAKRDSNEVHVSTLKVAISSEAARDPNAVKVVTNLQDRALYFSRAPVPYDRESTGRTRCYKHLGFYAYTIQALRQFRSLPRTPLEEIEHLEQLRFLENGIPITVVETTEDTIGVDTEEDLGRVEEYFRRTGIA
jgi:3-deoxy-manno-octulosonate cytidylyltransferase (CMP-KDO synthetase)